MNKKNWQIENLSGNLEFKMAANIVLENRLSQVNNDIKNYFESDSIEALHKIRISLRRLRYSMELFISCIDKKKFMILYKRVESLQDYSGTVRDFDVMQENMERLKNDEKAHISKSVFQKVYKMRTEYHSNLKLELMKFIHSKAVKNFQELLK